MLDCYQGFFEGKNYYLFDEAKTIIPTEAIRRIKALRISTGMAPKDFSHLTESFDTQNALSNQLQHFALKANSDAIVRVLGSLVPRAITFLKQCYMQHLSNQDMARAQVIPHQAFVGMEQLFARGGSIELNLDAIYPDASKVIAILEAKYDVLLHEAIKKFEKTVFQKIKQSVKISDHCHVGAPLHMPRITLSGWMNETYEPHRNSSYDDHWSHWEPISASYVSTLK